MQPNLKTIDGEGMYLWYKLKLLIGADINDVYREIASMYDSICHVDCPLDGNEYDLRDISNTLVTLLDYVSGWCPVAANLQQYTSTTLRLETLNEYDEFL